ncbi:AzlD domain-containing protein [Alphaproteobacteria bacterium]|nr:AzlD domain-containing protein [Alphaproteobacteria bacterium]
MIEENILLAILVSAIATYLCRFFGVLFSKKLKIDSWLFDWIKCISIGIIVAVISKIIFFPEGILEKTSDTSRILASFLLIIVFYISKKNILLSVILSTIFFTAINYYKISFL